MNSCRRRGACAASKVTVFVAAVRGDALNGCLYT